MPRGDNQHNKKVVPNANDLGLSPKQVHEARKVRDAEKKNPGAVKRAIDAKLQVGEEPIRVDVKARAKIS